ncbi:MAG: hypothetical protein KKB20_11695 [Proteobacteria bacterium]|nr:hypothetical protein [Pseudomonadota bacterium]
MPRKKIVDGEKLISAVESEMRAAEIMEKFDIKTSSQLKALYLDALVSVGRVPGLPGRALKDSPDDVMDEIKVNKRGSLVLSRKMVDLLGYNIDDTFMVRKTKAGLNIKKVEA